MAKVSNLFVAKKFLNFSTILLKRHLMTTSSCAEKAVQELEKNAYFEKYAEKIAKLQKTSPEEFLSRVDQLTEKKAPKKAASKPTEATVDGKFTQLLNSKKPMPKAVAERADEVPLDKIMKLDLIRDKTGTEIEEIWRQYHCEKDFISAVIPSAHFEELDARGREFPTFLFVLPRDQGYEFIMSQFARNTIHFTPLLYYQVHKENAPECLTITHFTEFKDDKKVVLMRGEYDKNIIDFKEAQCLANQLQLYYVKPTPEKLRILEGFTRKPDEFKHMDLINQIESLTL